MINLLARYALDFLTALLEHFNAGEISTEVLLKNSELKLLFINEIADSIDDADLLDDIKYITDQYASCPFIHYGE